MAGVMAVPWATQLTAGHAHAAAVEAPERVRLADFRTHLGSRMTRLATIRFEMPQAARPCQRGQSLGLPFCAQSAILAKCSRIATLCGLKCLFQTGLQIHLDGRFFEEISACG